MLALYDEEKCLFLHKTLFQARKISIKTSKAKKKIYSTLNFNLNYGNNDSSS